MSRIHPDIKVRHPSPNRSSRNGVRPSLIVIHATAGHNRPGIVDLVGLGNFFGQTSAQVSSHRATDNGGHSATFVPYQDKAWHVAGYNAMSIGIEQIIPGDGSELTALLYEETARWVAEINKHTGIPIRHATVFARGGLGFVARSGVIRHSELGIVGGGHADPGPYNFKHLLDLSKYYRKRI